MKNLYPFLNPIKWMKANKYKREQAQFDKSTYDLELYLYSKLLTNNMLHYGYFEDTNIRPETISFEMFEAAQILYAENIIEQINNKDLPILDVGCGMGGLSEMIYQGGYQVESLTPNQNQIEFIANEYPHLTTHQCKFEDYSGNTTFGTVINSESLQYIHLDEAFKKVDKIIAPDGRWIIIDYFSRNKKEENQRPHHLNSFIEKAKAYDWNITYQRDVTPNILPTLRYINMYVERFLEPLKHYGYEKLRFKKPKLFFLSKDVRESIDRKMKKEVKNIDPAVFVKERQYVLFVLDKK